MAQTPIRKLFAHIAGHDGIFLALTRLTLGWVFVISGFGKFTHLPQVIDFFQSLGIPFAAAQAPFVAAIELVCGLALLVGAYTRAAALLLIPVMVVAILTANREKIEGLTDLFGLSEFLYILLLFALCIFGAGPWSVDQKVLKKKAL